MSFPPRTSSSHRQSPLTGVNLRLLMVLIILFIDVVLLNAARLSIHGAADETAHVLTALLWGVLALSAGLPVVLPVVALGGMFPDLDHIPMLLMGMKSLPGSSRSVLHTLLVILIFLALARWHRRWRWVWGSLALGIASHLARDMATGTVILLWPVSGHPFTIPYLVYMGTLALCVVVPAFTPHRTADRPVDPDREAFVNSAATAQHHRVGASRAAALPDQEDGQDAVLDQSSQRELTLIPVDQRH